MIITLKMVIQEAEKIQFMIDSGELVDGCSMSAIQTPMKEAWSVADEITAQNQLHAEDKDKLLSMLNEETKSQLLATNFDDFDLIYEYFLQLIDNK